MYLSVACRITRITYYYVLNYVVMTEGLIIWHFYNPSYIVRR
jgi:hypothetical protein